MGLGKRVRLPTKVILPSDTSIADDESDYDAYVESLYSDESTLTLRPEDPPTRWNIRQLTSEQKDAVEAQGDPRKIAFMSIRCALLGVEHYQVEEPDGSVHDPAPPYTLNAGRLGTILQERWLHELNLPDEHILELFAAIRRFSNATVPLSQHSGPQSGE